MIDAPDGYPLPRSERIQRGFNRAALFGAMLCAGFAVWIGYAGRDQRYTGAFVAFAVIATATAYCLLWMLGRIIAGVVMLREKREKK